MTAYSSQRPRVTVVFPAFNEAPSIAQSVQEFLETGLVDEVVVVDNNSTDQTASLARDAGARVVPEIIQGYGAALRRGLREANGEWIVLAEPDATFRALDLRKLFVYAGEFDMVLGSRTMPELIWTGANMGYLLRYGNVLVAKLLELLYSGPCLTDCGCTFRLIRREAYQKIAGDLTVRASHFLPEMVIAGLRHGLRILEIPVNYRPRKGSSKITGTLQGTLRTGIRMMVLILFSRFRMSRRCPNPPS